MKTTSPNFHIACSFIQEEAWSAAFDPVEGISAWLTKVSAFVLEKLPFPPGLPILEVSVLFADNGKMQELNHKFRGHDKPTNVLSFPTFTRQEYESKETLLQGPILMMGDIVFALETIQQEVLAAGKSFEAHLTHLLVHGLLHLRGFDHETEAEASEMESLEIQILSLLQIDNPYESQDL